MLFIPTKRNLLASAFTALFAISASPALAHNHSAKSADKAPFTIDAFNNLSEETDFINDLKINSANLVDVILDVEDEFDIEIDNDSMEKMLSVKAALDIIETKLSAS